MLRPLLSRCCALFRPAPPPPPAVILLPAALARDLTADERRDLRAWLALPATRFALALMEARHPGTRLRTANVMPTDPANQLAAVYLLNRIRGWETYRDSLLTLAEVPTPAPQPVETYPSV